MSEQRPDPWKEAIEAAEREANTIGRAPLPPPARRSGVLFSGFGVSLAVLVALISYLQVGAGAPGGSATEAGRTLAASLAAEIVKDHMLRTGNLPEALPQAVARALRVKYRRTSDGYELEAERADPDTHTGQKP